jgi:hypothetical protein
VRLFQSHDALRVVGPAELPLVFMELISNAGARTALGQRAAAILRSQTGATVRTAEALQELLRDRTAAAPNPSLNGRGADTLP